MIETILQGLRWLGHDVFLLKVQGKSIYFDPFKIPDGLPPADLICITHDHYDHCSPDDIQKIRQASTLIVTEAQAASRLAPLAPQVKVLAPGESFLWEGIGIEAVPAYNIGKKFHPEKNRWLGFVLDCGGCRLYHAGDTDRIPEMKNIRAEIALLPVSGTYTMTAEEAVDAALDIGPRVAIPMHFGSLVGTVDDARRFAAGLAGRIRVEILAAA